MLKKNFRLSRNEVAHVFTKKNFHAVYNGFRLIGTENMQDHNRFCIVASKKNFRKAVERNKIRRRTYTALKAFTENTLTAEKIYLDSIIMVNKSLKDRPLQEFSLGLTKLINQISTTQNGKIQ